MSRNFAHFVGQFGIENPIILDSFKFSVPLPCCKVPYNKQSIYVGLQHLGLNIALLPT